MSSTLYVWTKCCNIVKKNTHAACSIVKLFMNWSKVLTFMIMIMVNNMLGLCYFRVYIDTIYNFLIFYISNRMLHIFVTVCKTGLARFKFFFLYILVICFICCFIDACWKKNYISFNILIYMASHHIFLSHKYKVWYQHQHAYKWKLIGIKVVFAWSS